MGLTEQLGAFTAQLTAEAQTAQAASLKADGLARAMVTAQANLASIEQKLAEVQVALTEGRVREAGLSGQLLKVEAERSELAEQLRQTELARQVAELAAESAGRETSEANSTRQTLVLENKALGEQFLVAQQASTALEFSLGEMQRSMASQTADLATQLANAQAQVATLQDASGNAHQDLELEIADLQNQLASVHQQVLSLTAELAEAIRALDDRLAQANKMEQQHSAQATVEMTEVMAQLANADTKYQAQQMAIEQLTNIAQDYEAQLKQAHQAMLAKQRDLEMMTEKLASKETLPTKTEQFQAEMAASLEAVREMLLRKEEELLALRQSKSANGSTTANQRAELARWEQAVTGLVAELQAKDSQLGTLGHALADRDRTLADATGLASEYSYQLNLAREEIRRLRAEVEDLSRELSRR
jgi:chromosome segregation ATPase